jgi:hypothetical protein
LFIFPAVAQAVIKADLTQSLFRPWAQQWQRFSLLRGGTRKGILILVAIFQRYKGLKAGDDILADLFS